MANKHLCKEGVGVQYFFSLEILVVCTFITGIKYLIKPKQFLAATL